MKTIKKRVLFEKAYPILQVRNVAASLDYYLDKLGFEKGFTWPPPCDWSGVPQVVPTYGEVRRGNFALHLAQNEEPGTPTWVYLDLASMADLDTLYHEYQASGASIKEAPTDKEWEMREMLVADLDGHTLRIGVPIHED